MSEEKDNLSDFLKMDFSTITKETIKSKGKTEKEEAFREGKKTIERKRKLPQNQGKPPQPKSDKSKTIKLSDLRKILTEFKTEIIAENTKSFREVVSASEPYKIGIERLLNEPNMIQFFRTIDRRIKPYVARDFFYNYLPGEVNDVFNKLKNDNVILKYSKNGWYKLNFDKLQKYRKTL